MNDFELSPYAKATLRDYVQKRRKLVWKNRWYSLIAWCRNVLR